MKDGKIMVMIAGLSSRPGKGKMASLLAKAIISQPDMVLSDYALAEEDNSDFTIDGRPVVLVAPSGHEYILRHAKGHDVDLVVDFTLPRSVNEMAEKYCAAGIPFVMGTTGGDRELLKRTVEDSGNMAVIATNFSVPVVIFQQMMKFAAETFPEALKDFGILIDESHQAAKVDKSGSAIGLLPHFSKLIGRQISEDVIRPERNLVAQLFKLGVPEQFLGGHGYHNYMLQSDDGTVDLRFEHNVRGRQTYVDGVLRAIRFVATHPNNQGRVFDMLDVLKG